jgi:hypothetical protein
MTIPILPAPCGLYKTTAAVAHTIDRIIADKKTLYVLPTKEAIAEVRDSLITEAAARGVENFKVTAIFQGAVIENTLGKKVKVDKVTPAIVNHFELAKPHHPEVLMITHESFKRLPHLTHRKFWAVICDEEVSVHSLVERNFRKTHRTITPFILPVPVNDAVYELQVSNYKALKEIIDDAIDDDGLKPFKELAEAILNSGSLTLVPKAQYDSLLDGTSEKGTLWVVDFLSDAMFTGFDEILLMAAFFEQTLQAKIWEKLCGTRFVNHPQLIEKVGRIHANGSNMTFYYVTEGKGSKSYLGKKVAGEDGIEVFDKLKNQMQALFGLEEFAWVASPARKAFDENRRIGCVSSGLNKFRKYTNVALMMSNNPKPGLMEMLKLIGLTEHEIRVGFSYMPLYQALMRIDIRNPTSTNQCKAGVIDKGFTDWMAIVMPDCKAYPIPTGLIKAQSNPTGAPTKHRTEAEKRELKKIQNDCYQAKLKARKKAA